MTRRSGPPTLGEKVAYWAFVLGIVAVCVIPLALWVKP